MAKILVVDDSEDVRAFLAMVLEMAGHEVLQAANGVEAVRLALRHSPDLLTLDLEMPVLNGFQTAQVFARLGYRIPIILLSGRNPSEVQWPVEENIVGHCLKSEGRTELLPLVEHVLQSGARQFFDLSYSVDDSEKLYLLSSVRRRRLLVVEDSLTLMRVLVRTFEADPRYEVFRARNGQEAILKAVTIEPDLILSDIEMPLIDGISMAQILYVIGRPYPIAFLSQHSDVEVVNQVRKLAGVRGYLLKDDFLRKPEDLIRRVDEMIEIAPGERQEMDSAYRAIDMEQLAMTRAKRGILSEA